MNNEVNNNQNNTEVKTKNNSPNNTVVNNEVTTPEVNNVQNNTNENQDIGDKTINAVEKFLNTKDSSNEFTEEEKEKNKTNAIICYIPLVFLYFLFTGKHKQSGYLKFHVNQGLIVSFIWIFAFFITKFLKSIFKTESFIANYTPGWISFISYLFYCVAFLLTLFGMISSAENKSKELPIIGKLKIIK